MRRVDIISALFSCTTNHMLSVENFNPPVYSNPRSTIFTIVSTATVVYSNPLPFIRNHHFKAPEKPTWASVYRVHIHSGTDILDSLCLNY